MNIKNLNFKQIFILLFIFVIILTFSNSVLADYTKGPGLIENKTWYQNLTNVSYSSLAFGDIDNDGDLDLVLTGYGSRVAKVYENNGTSFDENKTWQQNLTDVAHGSLAFGDIDNDGDLDLVLTGCDEASPSNCPTGTKYTKIYENNGTSFDENKTWQQNLTAIYFGAAVFGDIDNDGDLDLILTGMATTGRTSKVYLNNGTSLVESKQWYQNLTNVKESAAVLGDIDNDGDLDLVLTGHVTAALRISKVYLNNGTSLVESKQWYTNLQLVDMGTLALIDFDNDGDLDLDLTGCCDYNNLYVNNGTSFVSNQSLVTSFEGSVSWGDYDNDGDLDTAITGRELNSFVQNNNNTVLERVHKNILYLTQVDKSTIVWVDVDNDTDLDLVLTGGATTTTHSEVYTNNATTTNTKPTPPKQFTNYTTEAGSIHLGWGNGSDTETPSNGLYYNIRVGSTSGSNDIISGKYGGGEDNGYFGNMMQRKNFTLKSSRLQTNTQYFWSVRVIDTGLRQSSWSSEQKFTTIGDLIPPTVTSNVPINNYNSSSFNILFNATVYDNVNVSNVTLYGNWSGTWAMNFTNSSFINNSDFLVNVKLNQEGDGYYKWAVKACDNSSLCSWSENRTFLVDTHWPNVSLMSPANDSTLSSADVTFKYNVTDKAIENCSLIIDSTVDQTDYTITPNTQQSFSKTLSDGSYRWSVNCTDSTNHTNSSNTWDFSIEIPSVGAPSRGGVSIRERYECIKHEDCKPNEYCLDNKCVKLFDVEILDIESPISPKGFFEFTYLIKGMADIFGDVIIDFWLGDEDEKITSGSDTIYFRSFEEKIKTTELYLPKNIVDGIYKFYVQINYEGYKVISHRLIEIEGKEIKLKQEDKISKFSLKDYADSIWKGILIIALTGIIIFYFYHVIKEKGV